MRLLKSIVLVFGLLSIASFATNAYFSDQVTATGNQFSAGTLPIPEARVVINEVYYDPTGTDTGKEWIEIYNAGGQSINLLSYQMAASSSNYTFPNITLNSYGFIIIHWNTTGTDSASDLYTGIGFNNMGNTNGSVALFSSTIKNSSTIIDYLEYGSAGQTWEPAAVSASIWTVGTYISISAIPEGHSLERNPAGLDINTVSDFIDRVVPTPGS